MRSRRFRRRRRVRWAGEKLVWWWDAMDRLGPPWNEEPPPRKRPRR